VNKDIPTWLQKGDCLKPDKKMASYLHCIYGVTFVNNSAILLVLYLMLF